MTKYTINQLIRSNNGLEIELEDTMDKTNLDSFGFLLLMIDLDEMYGCFSEPSVYSRKPSDYTLQDVINIIKEK